MESNIKNVHDLNNQELINAGKDLHGALYHRINSLQRDLNIANAEIEKYKNQYNKLNSYCAQNHSSYQYNVKHECEYKDKLDKIKSSLT